MTDTEGAAQALTAGLRASLADLDTAELGAALTASVPALRLQLLTEGAAAMRNGADRWETRSGPIFVALYRDR